MRIFERGNTGGSICFKKIMWGPRGIHECCSLNFYIVFILILDHQLFLSRNFAYITSVLTMSCATGKDVLFVGCIWKFFFVEMNNGCAHVRHFIQTMKVVGKYFYDT
jgi:hypothetical protein